MLDIIKNRDLQILDDSVIELFVESYSSVACKVQIRGIAENALISFDHATNSNRTKATSSIGLTGIPISLAVSVDTAGIRRGQCFVKVYLKVEGVITTLLISGYVAETESRAWPNGKIESSTEGKGLIRVVSGTSPALGADISETVPTNVRWRIISFLAILITGPTLGNRLPRLFFGVAGGNIGSYPQTVVIPASTARGYSWDGEMSGNGVLIGDWSVQGINPQNTLTSGNTIISATDSIKADDQWSQIRYAVEEWIEP